jgi:hypothetical protein
MKYMLRVAGLLIAAIAAWSAVSAGGLPLISQFDPLEAGGLCGLAFDHTLAEV